MGFQAVPPPMSFFIGVTNCSFGNPRVAGSSLGRTVDRVVGEARLYSGKYRRI